MKLLLTIFALLCLSSMGTCASPESETTSATQDSCLCEEESANITLSFVHLISDFDEGQVDVVLASNFSEYSGSMNIFLGKNPNLETYSDIEQFKEGQKIMPSLTANDVEVVLFNCSIVVTRWNWYVQTWGEGAGVRALAVLGLVMEDGDWRVYGANVEFNGLELLALIGGNYTMPHGFGV
ncbi:hypothetical protein F5Y18DRAFT_242718 [Xylariaceae sp. FL1019]|nr:hypothetical protein F5Y18DRAFT_242718 [Xylariaceae sp. FL1019]